jgi:hypothetical protein
LALSGDDDDNEDEGLLGTLFLSSVGAGGNWVTEGACVDE